MVSLGKDLRSANVGHSFSSNSPQLFDETDEASLISSVLISNEEPHFKKIPIAWVIALEILCTIILFGSSFLVPYYLAKDVCFILGCMHAVYWCILFVANGYRNYHHNCIQRYGYLNFFRKTQLLQRMPLIISSLGNTLLVVILSIFQKYCSAVDKCQVAGTMRCHHYFQILYGLEACILLPCILKYLTIVIKFNKSNAIPDVHQDELLISYVHSYAPTNEIGFRDEDYVEEILEKQADMIRYLKQHCNHLSKKIMKQNAQIENMQGTAHRF